MIRSASSPGRRPWSRGLRWLQVRRTRSAVPERRSRLGLGRLRTEDRGSAMIEFVALGAILLLPCMYLVLTLGQVQASVFAVDVIARDAARISATERDPARAAARTREMAADVLSAHRLHADPAQVVEIHCSTTPCSASGATVTARARISVEVPGLGPVLGHAGPVTVGAAHVARADDFRDPTKPAGTR